MPSWNVHTAHVERLLREHAADELGIHDVNAFLFGNFVPDIYVGYMVRPITRTIEYRETHFADPTFVPEARFWEFWGRYGLPSADDAGHVSDVTLGAWCHLVADNGYNHWVNAFRKKRHIPSGNTTRVLKQDDFALFGRTLDISMLCRVDDELITQARAFPQYRIAAGDVHRAVDVSDAIVRENQERYLSASPHYHLLTAGLFEHMAHDVHERLERGLLAYAREGASAPELAALPEFYLR